MTVGLLSFGAAPSLVTGLSQVGLGAGELTAQTYIDVLKAWQCVPPNSNPSILDADGYPITAFSGLYGGQIIGMVSSSLLDTGPWILSWPSTRPVFKFSFLTSANVTATTGSPTITNGGGIGNFAVANSSGAGSVTFTFTGSISGITLSLDGSGGTIAYAAGTGDWTLMRVSDQAKHAAGQIYTDEYLAILRGLNPGKIRTMGWINNGNANLSSPTKWKYRNTTTSLSWVSAFMHPDAWGGTVTGTDFYTMSSPGIDNQGASWGNHETFYGTTQNSASAVLTFSVAANNGSGLARLTMPSTASLTTNQQVWVYGVNGNTTVFNSLFLVTVIDATHIDLQGSTFTQTASGWVGVQTITIPTKVPTTKFLCNSSGVPIGSASDNLNAATYQFYYDEDLDRVVASGVTRMPPVEVHAKLANALNCHLWTTSPMWADDDFETNWAQAILNNLNSHLDWYCEKNSEIWNTNFKNGIFAGAKGRALGITQYSYQGLRHRQVMALYTTVWAGQVSRLRRLTDTISVASLTTTLVKPYTLDGTELGPWGYNTSPNRPIDYTDVVTYAPYNGGCNLCNVADGGKAFAAVNAPALQNIVDLWDAGNSSAAIAAVDDDMRQGRCRVQTVTASSNTFTTPTPNGFAINNHVMFQVTGGTAYSGIDTGRLYNVTSASSNNFTINAFQSDGLASGANINAGTPGTGTMTVGWTNNMNTVFEAANGVHRAWQNLTEIYNAEPRPSSMANLTHHWYEGAIAVNGPSSAEAATLGLTGTNPSASIAAAINAWRFDPIQAATIQYVYHSYRGESSGLANFGLMTNAGQASNLVVMGGPPYALTDSYLVTANKYQIYYGVAAYNGV